MSILTFSQLDKICGGAMDASNATSFLAGLNQFGFQRGLNQPHRLAQYVAQMCHESFAFRYDQEIWGPTEAQKRYDTRTDLGNTPAQDGDGYLYRGRTGIQITGGFNYGQFTDWARQLDPNAPDFKADPDAVLTDPWEGLGPIWYWDTRELNRYADWTLFENGFAEVTRRINGGFNGYDDRKRFYGRVGLVLLGYEPTEVSGFQVKAGLKVDGDPGPITRQALHEALQALPPISPTISPTATPTITPELDLSQTSLWQMIVTAFRNLFGS